MASQLSNDEIEQQLKKLLNIGDKVEFSSEVALGEKTRDEERSLHHEFSLFGTSKSFIEEPKCDVQTSSGETPQGHFSTNDPSTGVHASPKCNEEYDIEFNQTSLATCESVLNHEEKDCDETLSKDKKRRRRRGKKSKEPTVSTNVQSEILDNCPSSPSQNGIVELNAPPLDSAHCDPETRNSNDGVTCPAMKSPTPHIFLREIMKFEAGTDDMLKKSVTELDRKNLEVDALSRNVVAKPNCSQQAKSVPVNPHRAAKALDVFNLTFFDNSPKNAIPEEIFAILKEQKIFALKKRSLSHPKAQYFCHLCEYHCDNLIKCNKHIKSNRHVTLMEVEELDMTLRQLPEPCQAQVNVINKLLMDTIGMYGLSQREIHQREYIAKDLREYLKNLLPECCDVMLYGSSLSGVGLKGCDVNLNLQVVTDSKVNPAHALTTAYDVIVKCDTTYSNVKTDWTAKLPVVTFTHTATGFQCVLGLNCEASCETSKLIKEYTQLDSRVGWLCTALRYWARECNVDKQMEGQLPTLAFDLMVIYFLQQMKVPVLPVLHEMTDDKESYMRASQAAETWKTKNEASIGFLWVELFRFYSLTFPSSSCVACIRESLPLTTAKKNWRGRKLAIEDPFSSKRNLARSVGSQKVYDFILSCLKLSFKYFGIPQTANGPLFTTISKPTNVPKKNEPPSETITGYMRENADKLSELDSTEYHLSMIDALFDEQGPLINGAFDDETEKAKKADQKREEQMSKKLKLKYCHLPTPQEIVTLIASVKEDEYTYAFKWHCLTGGKRPIVECSICLKEGHLKQNCPEDQLPPLLPLPPPSQFFTSLLTSTCIKIEAIFKPPQDELDNRQAILSHLQNFIKNIYPDARLELFGSSCNGFGFKNSDLDICLTFTRNKFGGQNLDYVETITFLAERLKKCKAIYQVVAIPTAKVPIVKFIHRQSQLECDISLYNTLAQHNTKMLRLYSEIDPRVRILGYTMKYFAKLCDIGDASRGSLSSYAYTLMVIFFLQQRNPPVIPVLQELYDVKKPLPTKMVDGWNAWYFDNIKKLGTVWPHQGKNRESIGDLWIGLLRFYSEIFDFKTYVVSIRQLKPMTRFEKLWNKKSIAIEDPFDLSHNLGMGVSRKMNNYIMKAFIRGRTIFGTPLRDVPRGYNYIEDYLFDAKVLTDGPPPNDRCCHTCGRIGHIGRDCPRRRGANNHQQQREEKAKASTNKNNVLPANQDRSKREVSSPRRQQEIQHKPRQQAMQASERTGFDRDRFQPQLPRPRQDLPRQPKVPPPLGQPRQDTPRLPTALPPPLRPNGGNIVHRQPYLYPMGIIPIKGFRQMPPAMPMTPSEGNGLRMMEPAMNHLFPPPCLPPGGFTNMPPPPVRIRTEVSSPPHLPR